MIMNVKEKNLGQEKGRFVGGGRELRYKEDLTEKVTFV